MWSFAFASLAAPTALPKPALWHPLLAVQFFLTVPSAACPPQNLRPPAAASSKPSKPSTLRCSLLPPLQLRPTACCGCTVFSYGSETAACPLKTFEPPLHLPSTASCGRTVFSSGSETAACPLKTFEPPLHLPSTASCGRTVFSSGSETAACPPQNPQNLRPSAAASFHC